MNCVIPFNVKLILKHKKGSQDMYRLLVYKTIIPKSQFKWNQVFQNMDMNWKSVYTVTKICCRNTKLYWFQYRLLHRILATKYLLTKMNIEQNNLCTFCGEEVEKLEHLFWQCNTVNTFWENIEQWIYDQNNYLINSLVEFSNEKSEGCCIYRHAGIDYIALWDSLLPLREVFAAYLGTCV